MSSPKKMTTPIDAWKAIAKFHEEQLAIAKKKVQEMESVKGVLATSEMKEPATGRLTKAEMKMRVLALETRTEYENGWNRAVENGLLMENVQDILEECYDSYLQRDMGAEFVAKAKKRMGKLDSLKWQMFILDVITHLKNDGSFDEENTMEFNAFDDTAGGCDEITWDAGMAVIMKTPMA